MGIVLMSLVAAMPAASATSSTVTSGKISCYVDAKTPTSVKLLRVTVTGALRLTCKNTGTVTMILNVHVATSVVELDMDRSGKFTIIDQTTELAESTSTVTVRASVGSVWSMDLATTSFSCVNTENDNEELSTRVKVSIVGGTWSTYDLSAYHSAPC